MADYTKHLYKLLRFATVPMTFLEYFKIKKIVVFFNLKNMANVSTFKMKVTIEGNSLKKFFM